MRGLSPVYWVDIAIDRMVWLLCLKQKRERRARMRRGAMKMDFILNNAAAIIAVAIVLGLAVGIFRALSGR